MVRIDHNDLNIIELSNSVEEVSFEDICKYLDNFPSFSIYFCLDEKFFGLVTGADVLEANRKRETRVKLRKDIASVGLNDYMEALRIFREKPGEKVIAIIDEDGRLLGEFQRWDDSIYLKYASAFFYDDSLREFFSKNRNIAMVYPSRITAQKEELFDKHRKMLEALGCNITIIDKSQVPEYFSKVNYIIVLDENEGWGIGAHYEAERRSKYDWYKVITLRRVEGQINNYISAACMDDVLISLQNRGVHVLPVFCSNNGSDYFKRIDSEISIKYQKAGIPRKDLLLEDYYQEYFDDLYDEEYVKKIIGIGFPIIKTSGMHKLLDCKSDVYNVVDGQRVTVGQPEKYDKKVLFFGKCFIVGYRVEDKNTIESRLQEDINEAGYKVRVENYGCWDSIYGQLNKIVSTDIHKGDIVVVHADTIDKKRFKCLNFMDVLERENVPSRWMVDCGIHVNHKGYKMFADGVFDEIKDYLSADINTGNESVSGAFDVVIDKYIKRYFSRYEIEENRTVGSIVMNCNPFTYGHRYLIEEALKIVDYLIIFVVQEDRSLFSYDMRMACVREGVSDIENVMVVPSGDFILSQMTFPEYFLKVEDEDLISNIEYDITLFAEKIAPRLNIKYRFVGEELSDDVTRQYNETMKRILPEHGVKLVEIPRKQSGEDAISASRVRELLGNMDKINEVKKLVPRSTLRVLGMDS